MAKAAKLMRLDANNRVVQIIDVPAGVDPAQMSHPDAPLATYVAGAEIGMVQVDGRYQWPLAQPIEVHRREARRAVIAYADMLTARITDRYSAAEVASWPSRAAEAQAVQAGMAPEMTPIITGLAAASGASRDTIAAAILAKASAYTSVVIAVTAIREQGEAAISAAATLEALTATLATLRQEADAKAAELGLA